GGRGGSIVPLRLGAEPGRGAELERHLAVLLPRIAALPIVAGAHVCVAGAEASPLHTAEGQTHGAAVPDWLVMIEGVNPESASAACDTLLASDLRSAGASA